MAPHVLLEEGGEPYEVRLVDLRRGEHRTEAYRKINPGGNVPALQLDDGEVIGENTAILPFLGKRFGLWPTDTIEEARALSLIGFFATTVATAHARALHPDYFVLDEAAIPTVKAAALEAFHRHLNRIDQMLAGKQWLLGKYSPCDPYAFGFYTWGLRRDMPMVELRNFTRFKDQMLQRPAVRRIVEKEGLRVN